MKMMAMMPNGTIGTFGAISSRRGVVRMFGGLAAAAASTGLGDPAATRRKQHREKPVAKNGTTVTQVFSNTAPIAINTYGSATPFPSRIQVSGLEKAIITDVDLVLNGLSHLYTVEVDIMLVAPDGRNTRVMSHIGSTNGAKGLVLQPDVEAGTDLPGAPVGLLMSGAYRPTNIGSGGVDVFDTISAPVPPGNVARSTFDGGDPNREWQLFVRDDYAGNAGSLAGGWELHITATIPARKTKHKKKRQRRGDGPALRSLRRRQVRNPHASGLVAIRPAAARVPRV